MSSKSNPLLRLLLGLLVVPAIGVMIRQPFQDRSKTLFSHPLKEPRLVLTKATIVGWDHGERLWEISGDSLEVDHDNHFLNYTGHGKGKLYYKNKPYLTVYAPQLRFDMISKGAQALRGVRVYANPSTALVAEVLYWNQTSQRLYIPGQLRIRGPYGTFHANHLIFEAFEGHLTMEDVRMAVRVNVSPDFMSLIKGDRPEKEDERPGAGFQLSEARLR